MKNILFIMADQHNSQCFSYKNHADVKTPNLDMLASQSVTFENAYCNNPICTPSRMSFLSSQYASTHGYFGLYGREPSSKITNMFSHFKEKGYRTGALGKLHTPRYWIERDCQFIYDEFIEYPKYLEGAGLYEKNDNRKFTGIRDGECSFLPYEHSCESVLVKQFKRFIDHLGEPADRVGTQEPWFSWVSFARPHKPFTPSKEFYDMYNEDEITLAPISDTETDSVIKIRKDYDEKQLRKEYRAYLALVSQVDYGIGQIIELLKERKILDNTIIVYTADHGDYASEHGLMEKKNGISFSAITKIPLIIFDPTKTNTGERKQIVQSIDLFPTLCEMIGVEIPDTIQGKSMVDLMVNKNSQFRDYALTENLYRKAIATKEFRFITNIQGEDELYDIVNDPHELQNLINDKKYLDIIAKLQRKMIDAIVRTNYPVTIFEGFWYPKSNSDNKADLKELDEQSFYC